MTRLPGLAAVVALFSGGAQAETQPHFPYQIVTVPGAQALSEWQRLSEDPATTPIILGGDDDLDRVTQAFDPEYGWTRDVTVAEILSRADNLSHPQAIDDLREAEMQQLLEFMRKERGDKADTMIESLSTTSPELVGTWPDTAQTQTTIFSIHDYMTGRPYTQIHIAILPTADPTEAPAYLYFGGWNANPAPEYHVAALRSWRDRYGAVPVAITGDVIELRVGTRPESQAAALDLATEQYRYCEDIVLQGTGTLSNLAATLMESDYWYFWWD